ncbi:MAG: pyridoxal phosphate-dependent aminotransferase family protein [Acidobacteriota bacterium]
MKMPCDDASLPEFETPEGPRVTIDGTDYDWFRGNGYLGLYGHPDVLRASVDATLRYGMRLRDRRPVGCHPCVLELERQARRTFACDAVALFNSGYAAVAGLASGLHDRCDAVFLDDESHFSLADAMALLDKPLIRFAHRDADDLKRKLRSQLRPGQRPLVASDGIFPISGTLAPVPDYVEALETYPGASLLLDDAHAAGVLGKNGRGILEHFGLEGAGRFSCATLSKAFGSFGGLVAGERGLVEDIRRRSGAFRGSALPPPGVVAASAAALALARRRPRRRRRLVANLARVRRGLHGMGLAVDPDSPSPIICLDRRNPFNLKAAARRFFDEKRIGVFCLEGGYPSTPVGGALVFTVFANHSRRQIDRLLEAFRQLC